MTHENFNILISTYGANPEHWPEYLRAEAEAYMVTHADAAASALKSAKALDTALDTLSAPPPSDLLRARILKSASTDRHAAAEASNDRLPAPGWRGIAAMVMVAFGTGFGGAQLMTAQNTSAPQTQFASDETSSEWELVAEDLGFSDVYSWVEGDTSNSPASNL